MKVAFLDRDGTINVDRGYVHRIEDWEFTPAACEALALLCGAGFRIAIITNQSGIAAGLYTAADAERLHEFMCQKLGEVGVIVDAIAYCPHPRDGDCDCRKPRTGMARIVESKLGQPIDYAASWTIGDKLIDVEFGKSLGMKTALIRSRYWTETLQSQAPDLIADTLFDAVQRITALVN